MPPGVGGNVIGTAVGRLIVDPSGVARGVRQAAQEVDRGTAQMARNASQRMNQISGSLTSMAGQFAVFSLAAGGLFAAGIASAASFQEKLVEIGARSGATAKEIKNLDETITQQAANTIFNAKQIGDAYLFALTSGQSLNEALANMPEVLDLAAAGGLDVSRAMDIATNIIAQFNETVEATPLIVDSLNAAAASSPATIGQLGDAFTNAGNVASIFGLNIRETSEVFGVFAKQGIRGAQAGTLLRSMLSFMTRDTAATTGAWKKLGVELFDTEGTMRGMDDVFSEVADAMDDMNEQERIMVSRDIAGRFGIQGFNALVAARGVAEMREEMEGAAKAGDVAAARMNTFARQLESLQGSIDALLKEAFTPLMEDVLTPLLKRIIEITNSVRDWAKANPELMKTITGMIGVVALIAPALFGLALAFKAGAIAMAGFATIIAVVTSPVSLLIVAVAGLAFAIISNFRGIRDTIEGALLPFQQAISDTIEFITEMKSVVDLLDGREATVRVRIKTESDTTDQELADLATKADLDIELKPNVKLGRYEVKPGDTLWDVWQSGESGLSWDAFKKLVQAANPELDISALTAGATVKMPVLVGPDVQAGTTGSGEHVVKAGDSLWAIWKSMEDDSDMSWSDFLDFVKKANPGINVGVLRVGATVKIPVLVEPEPELVPTGLDAIAADMALYVQAMDMTRHGRELGTFIGQKIAELLQIAVESIGDFSRFLTGGFYSAGYATLDPGGGGIGTEIVRYQEGIIDAIADSIFGAPGQTAGLVRRAEQFVSQLLENLPVFFDFANAEIEPAAKKVGDAIRTLVEDVVGKVDERFADFPAWVDENVIMPVSTTVSGALTSGMEKLDKFLFGDEEAGTGNIFQRLAPTAHRIGDNIRALVEQVLGGAGIAFADFTAWFATNVIAPVSAFIGSAIASGFERLDDFLFGDEEAGTGNILQRLAPVSTSIGASIETLVKDVLKGAPVAFADFTAWFSTNVIMPVSAAIIPGIEEGMAALGKFLFGDADAGTGNILQRLQPMATSIAASLRTLVEEVLRDAPQAFEDFGTWAQENIVMPITEAIGPDIEAALASIGTFLLGDEEAGTGNILQRLQPTVDAISGSIREFVDGLLADAPQSFEDFGAWFDQTVVAPIKALLLPGIESGLASITDLFLGAAVDPEFNSGRTRGPNIVERVIASVTGFFESIDTEAIGNSIRETLTPIFGAAIPSLGELIGGALAGIEAAGEVTSEERTGDARPGQGREHEGLQLR